MRSSNAWLADALFTALQVLSSGLLPGTGGIWTAAHARLSAVQRCTVAAWVVQATLGFVLPTLVVWTAQARAVERWAAAQGAAGRSEGAALKVARSQYAALCRPALAAAAAYGWPVTLALAAAAAFVAGTLSLTGGRVYTM